jgi:uncharacterized protein
MTMTTLTQPLRAPAAPQRAWYREPYMWLVLGLPLVAVMGSITAAVIAVKVMGNDPLLDRTPAPVITLDAELLDKLTPEQRIALEMSLSPARTVRNHAASPELPKD